MEIKKQALHLLLMHKLIIQNKQYSYKNFWILKKYEFKIYKILIDYIDSKF